MVMALAFVPPIVIEFAAEVSSVPFVLYCKLDKPLTAPVPVMPPALLLMPPVIEAPLALTVSVLETPNVPVMLEFPPTVIPPAVTEIPVALVTDPVKLAALDIVCPFIVELVVTAPVVSTEKRLPAVTRKSMRLPLGAPLVLVARISACPAVALLEALTLSAALVPEFMRLKTPAPPELLFVKL